MAQVVVGAKVIDLFVAGVPQPKGSMVIRRGRIVSDNPQLKGWEDTIRSHLFANRCEMIPGAVQVELGFWLPQPPSRMPKPRSRDPAKRHPVPDVKPDLDKLIRGTLDAFTKTVIEDDNKVVAITAYKTYVGKGEAPGVRIRIRPYPTMEAT